MTATLRRRLIIMGALLAAVTVLLTIRLFHVQVVQGAQLREQASANRQHRLVIPDPSRGVIADRNGTLLAINELRYAIEAYPPYIRDPQFAAERLGPILRMPAGALAAILGSDQTWVSLERYATMEQGEAVEQLGIEGIAVQRRWVRAYPHGSTLAHLLGFVSWDGQGFYGLEGYYDRSLQGQATEWVGETGPSGRRPLPQAESSVPPAVPGSDLVLTLDLGIQALAEMELRRAMQEYGAQGGTIIVMDPRTGAILALADQPTFDPNHYEQFIFSGQDDAFQSPAYGAQYEPGSVFKIITMAAALDSGTVTPQSTYVDRGRIEYGGRQFTNWDQGSYGEQDMVGLLGHSLNVGAVNLAIQIGPDTFYRYVRAFGFGQPTGVDLQGEASGRVRTPDDLDWHDSDLGTNSFGQGLAVTPLQMISAVAAVANEGRLMRPYLVARQILPDGTAIESQPVVRGQPISAETARTLSEMLGQVVEQHMPQAQVEGYRIAGKSGTAQIPVPGGYDPRWTIASYVGFGPVDDPQWVILVRLDRPQVSPWGSQTAAVVFQRLASQMPVLLGIPPD